MTSVTCEFDECLLNVDGKCTRSAIRLSVTTEGATCESGII